MRPAAVPSASRTDCCFDAATSSMLEPRASSIDTRGRSNRHRRVYAAYGDPSDARPYHAFLAFIERAAQNRRGSGNPRSTADALNNYIPQGLGLTPVFDDTTFQP